MIIWIIGYIACFMLANYIMLKFIKHEVGSIECPDMVMSCLLSLTGPLAVVAALIAVFMCAACGGKIKLPGSVYCHKVAQWINKKI